MYENKIEKIVANFFNVAKVKTSGNKFAQDCIVLLIKEKLRTPNVCLLYWGIMKFYDVKLDKGNIARDIRYFIAKDFKSFPMFDKRPSNWIFIKTVAEYIAMNLLEDESA